MYVNRNETLVHSLWDVHHKMRRLHDGKSSQSRILIVLREHESMTQRELTDHLHVQPGSASEILSKMEQSGLITRMPNQSDQRTMDIFLTEKGRTLVSEAMEQRKALYPGNVKPVLSHIDFTIHKGEMVAIMGATGCGKTTLVNLIPRFYDVTNASVIAPSKVHRPMYHSSQD